MLRSDLVQASSDIKQQARVKFDMALQRSNAQQLLALAIFACSLLAFFVGMVGSMNFRNELPWLLLFLMSLIAGVPSGLPFGKSLFVMDQLRARSKQLSSDLQRGVLERLTLSNIQQSQKIRDEDASDFDYFADAGFFLCSANGECFAAFGQDVHAAVQEFNRKHNAACENELHVFPTTLEITLWPRSGIVESIECRSPSITMSDADISLDDLPNLNDRILQSLPRETDRNSGVLVS